MYFENAGKVNTEKTVELALKAADEYGIDYIVVASNSGYTAEMFKNTGKKVVVVTHVNGFEKSGENQMVEEERNKLKELGFEVYTSTHVLSGAERSLSRKFGGINPVEIMAYTLRMFGQGLKVAVEVSIMALDGGVIPYGEDIIAIGGTGNGADTAIIVRPSHASSLLDYKIKEIICKPREW
jgi:uncharacterized protein